MWDNITDIFSLQNILFEVGGRGISLTELLGVLSGLLCVFLAGRNSKHNFWIGYVYNILLFSIFLQRHLYSAMLLQPISFGFNILGHWRWTHPKKEEQSENDSKKLKVSSLDLKSAAILTAIIIAATLLWGYVLSNLGVNWFAGIFNIDPAPFMDAFILIITLAAIYLSAQKKWQCWIFWIFVNIVNIVLYIKAGLVFMPVVGILYLMNGIWALYTWFKLYKNNR